MLRVDYVWRLTHRYPGYPVDRSGVRLAVHVTFDTLQNINANVRLVLLIYELVQH